MTSACLRRRRLRSRGAAAEAARQLWSVIALPSEAEDLRTTSADALKRTKAVSREAADPDPNWIYEHTASVVSPSVDWTNRAAHLNR